MVRSFKELRGFAVRATDGRFGTVSDIYFDDRTWRVRYCVVDSGRWLANRYVLIGSRSLSVLDFTRRQLWVRLSKAEVGLSRNANSDKPVSKQDVGIMTSIRRLGRRSSIDLPHPLISSPDRHLRSCKALIGLRLDATDGKVGNVDDFLIDDKGWVVRKLLIDVKKPDASVVIEANHVDEINWAKSSVAVSLTGAAVLDAPTHEPMSSDANLPPLAG